MESGKPLNSQSSNKCEYCGKQFSQRSSRNRHIKEQHEQRGSYGCKKCGLRFSKKFNLQMHEKHAHPKAIKKGAEVFRCSHCSCIFTKISVLKKHITDYHEKNRQGQKIANSNEEDINEIDNCDPQKLAENVLQELKQLQRDILPETADEEDMTAESLETYTNVEQEVVAFDSAIVEEISIKDKLYPLGYSTQYKVQRIKRSDGNSYYICEYCSKEFKKTYGFLRHRRIHTKIRPFICVLCKKSFSTIAQLKRHCFIHRKHEKFGTFHRFYKCPNCEEGFTSIKQLDKHISSHVETNISFECPECLKTFKSLKSLIRHKHYSKDNELKMLKSLLPKPISLIEGDNISKANTDLPSLVYICSLCGLQLSSKLMLTHHEKRHQNLYKYQCNICNGCYVSQSSLKIHQKIHTSIKNFNCEDCGKNFITNYQLKRHQLTHSEMKKYKCQYCDKTYKTKQNCRSHMMTHLKELINSKEEIKDQQERLITYPTIIQDLNQERIITTSTQIIKTIKNLTKKIMIDIKKDDLKYKCLKCNKSFRYVAWLRKHFKYKHTGEKPFECVNCLKKFKTKQILQTHLLIHNESKSKVICQVCGKQYSSNKSLKLHLRIHTEEKPFKCVECQKQFRTSGHLKQHHKSNHKE